MGRDSRKIRKISSFKKKGRVLIFIASSLLIITVILAFAEYKSLSFSAKPKIEKGEISLSHFQHTAREKGKTLWTLAAEKANYSEDEKIRLTKIKASYLGQEENPVKAASLQGKIDVKSKDIELFEDVIINYKNYTFETQKALYKAEERLLISPSLSVLSGPQIRVEAEYADYKLNSEELLLKGRIRGRLDVQNP